MISTGVDITKYFTPHTTEMIFYTWYKLHNTFPYISDKNVWNTVQVFNLVSFYCDKYAHYTRYHIIFLKKVN